MNRNELVSQMNLLLKSVRMEYGFTQEQMAPILGMSKKTLVEIEKGRSSLGWSGAVVLCSLFGNSEAIGGALGGEPTDIVMALAFTGHEPEYPRTMGGKVWWRLVEEFQGFRIQQNIISQHFRALNQEDQRVCSSFDLDEVKAQLSRQEHKR